MTGMKREDRILDFVVFILSDYEELLSHVTYFFIQDKIAPRSEDPFSTKNEPTIEDYRTYINKYVELPRELLSNKNENYKPNFQTIRELISIDEEVVMLEYLNDNFLHGYPEGGDKEGGVYGGNWSLDISKEELNTYFNKYLKFTKVNNKVYISFFVLLFEGIEKDAEKALAEEINKIDGLKRSSNSLSYDLSKKFKEYEQKNYTNKLFRNLENGFFQINGFFDKNRIYINYEDSLINQLKILPPNFTNHTLSFPFELHSSLSYLSLQYLEYILFDKKIIDNSEDDKVKLEIENKLSEFKNKYKDLIDFLKEKSFTDTDINILINLLFQNQFSNLKIRYYSFSRKVHLFHILYSFYVFDNYNNKLDSINDYKNLILQLSNFDKEYGEQLRKYHKNIDSNREHKHYPFKSIDKTLEKVEEQLEINREKLKKIPPSNSQSHRLL